MIYDLIIIGGGPAGITAGIYAARKALKALLLTKDFVGQVGKTGEVDNWPGTPDVLGMNLIKQFEQHLKKFDIETEDATEVIKVDKTKDGFAIITKDNKKFSAKTVIVSTGRAPRLLNVEGEKEFIGKGVSYCAICDGPFFQDKSVAVIGGGNAGVEAALDLSKYTKRVFIFERAEKMMADELLQKRASKKSNIQVHTNKKVEKIEGKGKVQSLIYRDTAKNKEFQVGIDGVFVEIGSVPVVGYLHDLVEFTDTGEVKVNPQTCETSTPGLFAAGDLNDKKWKQIVTAASDGCRAALSVHEYLRNK